MTGCSIRRITAGFARKLMLRQLISLLREAIRFYLKASSPCALNPLSGHGDSSPQRSPAARRSLVPCKRWRISSPRHESAPSSSRDQDEPSWTKGSTKKLRHSFANPISADCRPRERMLIRARSLPRRARGVRSTLERRALLSAARVSARFLRASSARPRRPRDTSSSAIRTSGRDPSTFAATTL